MTQQRSVAWRARLIDVVIVAAVLLVFWIAAFYQIRLPGFYYDEAADVVPAMQIVQGDPQPLDMAQSFSLGPLRLPVMVMAYVGAVSTYAVLPLYWLFGAGVEATRAMTIVMASLALVFTYMFLKELFDRRVAALTILLAAVHPSFVFWSRMGIYVSSPMLTMAAGALWCLLRWRRSGQARYFYAAALFMGLGMSAKLLFLWFILALAAASLALGLWPRLRIRRWTIGSDATPPLTRGAAVAALAWFAAGAWMFIVYNLTTLGTVRVVLRNLITTGAGANNLNVVANLRTVFGQLIKVLTGTHHQNLWGPAYANRLYAVIFFACLAILAVLAVRRLLPWPRRRVAFAVLVPALIWLQSAFTISALGATHLYILSPWLPTIIVLAVLAVAQRLRSNAIVVVVIAALLLTDGWAVGDHHRALAQSGGVRLFSDSIYALAGAVDRHDGPVVAADWGFRANVAILTQGRVWPIEVFGANVKAPPSDFAERIAPYLAQPDAWLLFHAPASTSHQGRLAAARKLAAEMGRTLVLERTFYQRDGAESIYVYRTEAAR